MEGLMDVESHVAPRREFNAFAPIRPSVLHVYGVDFLSNKEVLALFADFEPKEVEWLDDSSCNIVFSEEEAVKQAMDGLHNGVPSDEDVWRTTRPLKPSSGATGNVRKSADKELTLQLRLATEADRKDPGHSGHTDSIYYALVKEQQALQKQNVEARREKKRQRMQRPPQVAAAPGAERPGGDGSKDAQARDGSTQVVDTSKGAGPDAAGAANGDSPAPLRLGCRGILDPLLYLRAGSAKRSSSQPPHGDGGKELPKDLAEVLQKAEAEYASLPAAASSASAAAPNAQRDRRRNPGDVRKGGQKPNNASRPLRHQRTPSSRLPHGDRPGQPQQQQQQQLRGKKRRPVEQEPRAVKEGGPAQRAVTALPEVEAFLSRHRLRCQRVRLVRSLRSIIFAQQKRKKVAAQQGATSKAKVGEAKVGEGTDMITDKVADKITDCEKPAAKDVQVKPTEKEEEELPPWEQYMKVNATFTRMGHLVHTVAWQVQDRRVLVVVPYGFKTDTEKLCKVLREPAGAAKLRKLQDIAANTGWPVFVCPPFGHPKDKQGRDPVLLVDSSVTEFKKPLLFDCGTVGLAMTVSEFLRSTGAACVEGLAVPQATAGRRVSASSVLASPEPAPEPAPSVASPGAMPVDECQDKAGGVAGAALEASAGGDA